MKFVLFVEGDLEAKALPSFLKRWLDKRLNTPIGFMTVNFTSWSNLVKDGMQKTIDVLNDPTNQNQIVAVIGIIDLYGPDFYPDPIQTVAERYNWGREHIEKKVNHVKYRQYFAVHETEAWLLSNPSLFPSEVKKALPTKIRDPEKVNFGEPPAKLIEQLYQIKTRRKYKKAVDGVNLFRDLDPEIAYEKCPYLRVMLDEMLQLAKDAGL